MSHIQVFHNPRFLEYRGDHDQIVPPLTPTASVRVPGELAADEKLSAAYARTQHGYLYGSWFQDPTIIPHLRSTSVGDLLATENDDLFVVERMGFRPFRPTAQNWKPRLLVALQNLEGTAALAQNDRLKAAVQDSLIRMNQALLAEEYPVEEMPKAWEDAEVGDLVGNDLLGYFRVFARRLEPKWRALLLQEHLPQGKMWRDNSGWAVLQPVSMQIK